MRIHNTFLLYHIPKFFCKTLFERLFSILFLEIWKRSISRFIGIIYELKIKLFLSLYTHTHARMHARAREYVDVFDWQVARIARVLIHLHIHGGVISGNRLY